jgi:hypothetical protein
MGSKFLALNQDTRLRMPDFPFRFSGRKLEFAFFEQVSQRVNFARKNSGQYKQSLQLLDH